MVKLHVKYFRIVNFTVDTSITHLFSSETQLDEATPDSIATRTKLQLFYIGLGIMVVFVTFGAHSTWNPLVENM